MNIRYPDYIAAYGENVSFDAKRAKLLAKDDVRIELLLADSALKIFLLADKTPMRYIKLRWNFSENEKRNEDVKVYGDVWERSYGDIEWRGIEPWRTMPWVCAASNGSDLNEDVSGRCTSCFGVKVRPHAMCFWQYDTCGVTLWLDVRCGGSGVILGGRKAELCTVLFADYREVSAFSALKAFYKTLCDAPLSCGHKVYGANNWYYAYGETSHAETVRDASLLAEMTEGLSNRPYSVLDDGWQKNPCDAPWDVLREGKFQDMKAVADEVKSKNVRPGIWFRPLRDKNFEVFPADSELRLARDAEFLDPSHPAVLAYVAKTVNMICDWGFELIKHDFSTFDAIGFWGLQRYGTPFAEDGWSYFDRSKKTAEVILGLNETIYNAAKGRALILGCNVMGHLAAGLVHLNRTGDDTSGKDWHRMVKFGVNALAFRMLHHGAFYESDADCVGFMGIMDHKYNKQWLKAVACSGTPLFVSPNPDVLTAEERKDIEEAYRINSVQSDTLIPLDWMENAAPEHWLLNEKHVKFDWYPEDGVDFFFI